jgi:5'-nucleotidase
VKILVSNDDGIHAAGIQALAARLAKDHEVYIVAPDSERSATGHALTLHRPIRMQEIQMPFPVKQAYAISGTPSDCVKLALNALLPDVQFDVLVSGINHGPNLGSDVIYSGTVSAALEGAINGIPSIAVSLVNGNDKSANFRHGADFIADFLATAMQVGIPPKSILNVNIPAVPRELFAGVKIIPLGTRMYTDTYERREDPRGNVYFWLAGEIIDSGAIEDSDVEAIRDNMVSVTPVHYDLTNYNALAKLKESFAQANIQVIGNLPVEKTPPATP